MARIQLLKISQILTQTRKLKRTFLQELTVATGYQLQRVDDPKGDCGINHNNCERPNFSNSAHRSPESRRHTFRDNIQRRIPRSTHLHLLGSILDKNSHHPSGYPWKDPTYKGDVEYTHDMCPNTLSILGKSLRFGFNVNMLKEHTKLIAAAINKVNAVCRWNNQVMRFDPQMWVVQNRYHLQLQILRCELT